MKYDILVIGGGPAGVVAALRARELGKSVALVERDRMGGTATNDGCAPTRVLAKTARLLRESRQFSYYGLMGPAPELDFQRLLSRAQSIVYKIHEKKQLIQNLRNKGVDVFHDVGSAAFVDPYTIAVPDGRQFQADKFILCTGGRSRRLDFPGEEYALTHTDLWSLKSLPRSIIIVGGAATGCQLASIFSAFGAQVTLLERAPRLLRIEDESVAEVINQSFLSQGIQIITEIENVNQIEKNGQMLKFSFTKGGTLSHLEAEAVFLSSGWLGNLSSLNLEAANVKSERNYVLVDDYLRTSAPHIFAAGDINGRMMLVQSASYEAGIAAENAALGVGEKYKPNIVPHGGFTDPEYAGVGLTEEQARNQGIDYLAAVVPYQNLDRAVIDDRTVGLFKLLVSQETHRILGAHVVGEQAVEIIHVISAGMATDMWVEQLSELELAYPTFTAIIGLAARQLSYRLGVEPLAHQWVTTDEFYPAEWEHSPNL